MEPQLVSKGEFAAMINVSPGRVSQFIAAGQISRDAMVGSGQRAKINVERAKSDLRLTLDVSQRLGNGSETNIEPSPGVTGTAAASVIDPDSAPRGADHEIKLQKLEQLRRANRNAAVAEARDAGLLTDTVASKAELGRVASAMLDVFEGSINDMAMAIAAQFELPQRDVKHLLRGVFRQTRETAAKQMRDKAITLPEMTQIVIEGEDTDQSAVS